MSKFICDSIEGQYILPSIEEQILNRIITFYVLWSPPFINYRYDNKSMICGPFIKFLRELSIKHNYRFVIAKNSKKALKFIVYFNYENKYFYIQFSARRIHEFRNFSGF